MEPSKMSTRPRIFGASFDSTEKPFSQRSITGYILPSNLIRWRALRRFSIARAFSRSSLTSFGKKVVTDVIIKLDDPTEGVNSLRVLIPDVAKTVSTAINSFKINASHLKLDFLWKEAPIILKKNFLIHFKEDFDLLG